LKDYAAITALVALLSVAAVAVVGERIRCILIEAGRALIGLNPQGCVVSDGLAADGSSPSLPVADEPTLEIPSGMLPLATLGQNYFFQFEASDPLGHQITFLVPDGLLPPGLLLTPGGTLVGIPTQADAYTFPVTVRTPDGREASGSYTLVVNAPPIWMPVDNDALRLPEGLPFSVALRAIDPDGQPVSYTIAAGELPGAFLDSTTGLFTGTAPASGTFPVTFRASDPDGASSTIGVTFTVTNNPVWVTPAGPLPGAQAGTPYLFQLEARDLNQDQLTFQLLDGNLPPGLSLDMAGTIFGTPEAAGGDATFTVGVSDGGPFVPRTFSIAYTQPPSWITSSLPTAVRGAPYTVQLEAQDPDGDPLTFRLVSGLISDLGLTLTPQGLLSSSNIPRNFPLRQLTFEVSDGRGGRALATFGLGTSAPPQWNTPAGALPIAQLDQVYNADLVATDPEGGSLLFAVVSGRLPSGVTLNAATGRISGAPTEHGDFSFTVRATDPDGGTAERTFSLAVNRPPVFLTDATLPQARAGDPYTARIETADPDGDAVVFLTQPPGGGAFAADGTFSLTVAADRTTPISFLVRIRDARGGISVRTFQIPVLGAPVWQTTTLPRHFGPGPYVAAVLATDPNGGTVSYAVVSGPPGAVMDGAELRVSPVAFGPVRLRATNTAGLSSERDFEIREDTPPVWVSAEDLGVVAVGERPAPLEATDDGTLTYHLVGGALPDGLALSPDGRFTGAAATPGAFSFTVEARDGVTPPAARTFSIVTATRPTIGLGAIAPLPRTGAVAVDLQIQSPDGPARLTATPAPETIHPSLVLTPDGILQGEDVVLAAPIPWTVEARHPIHDGLVSMRTFLLSSQASPAGGGQGSGGAEPPANRPPVFITQALPVARPGLPYSVNVEALDPEGEPVALTLLFTSQEAPGLDFDGQAIFGIPTTSGRYRYDLRAQDPGGAAATASLTLDVNAPPAILGPDLLPMAQQGRPYGPVALLGTDPEGDDITWSFAPNGGVPGLSIASQTGILSGTPTQAGVRAIGVRASDATGASTRSWTLVVNAQPVPTVPEGYLPPLVIGTPYSIVLGATDADGDAVSATVLSGSLPDGLALDAATGTLSGTPLDDADRQIVVRFSDGRGGFADRTYRLAGNMPPVFTTPADLGVALVGTPFSATIVATDPNPGDSVTLELVDGGLPEGISFSPQTGVVSGTVGPGPGGEFFFTVRASDPKGAVSERTFTIRVNRNPTLTTGSGNFDVALNEPAPATPLGTASDPDGDPLTWELEVLSPSTALPAGLSFDSQTGRLTGIPTGLDSNGAQVRVRVRDPYNLTSNWITRTIRVLQRPVWATDPALPVLVLGSMDWTATVVAYIPGSTASPSYSLEPAPTNAFTATSATGLETPAGPRTGLRLGLNAPISSGGPWTWTITASNGGLEAVRTFTIASSAPPVWQTSAGQLGAPAIVGTPFSRTVLATDPEGQPVTYSIVSGILPPGVGFAGGVFSGTPTGEADVEFVVRATDPTGLFTDRTFRLLIAPSGPCTPFAHEGGTSSYLTYIVPAGCSRLRVTLEGGGGGGFASMVLPNMNNQHIPLSNPFRFENAGGLGARVDGTISVSPNQTLRIFVGFGGRSGTDHVQSSNALSYSSGRGGNLKGGIVLPPTNMSPTMPFFQGGEGGGGTGILRIGPTQQWLAIAGGGGGAGTLPGAFGGSTNSNREASYFDPSGLFMFAPSYASPSGSMGNGGSAPITNVGDTRARHPCRRQPPATLPGTSTQICIRGHDGQALNANAADGGNGGNGGRGEPVSVGPNLLYHVLSGGGGGGGFGGGAGGTAGYVQFNGGNWLYVDSISAGGGGGGSLVPQGGTQSYAPNSNGYGLRPGRDGRVFIRGAP
jgi:hypothetical protein